MRIIARSTLRSFWETHSAAEEPLKAWFRFLSKAKWKSSHDVKKDYSTASFLKENRVCFNIGGNKFRVIVKINYDFGIVYIRFVGTHAEYDRIDADEV